MLRHGAGRPGIAQRGVSLVEIGIVLLIIAIVVAMGIPSFSEYLQNAQVRTATESIMTGLQTARNEAVRRNAPVTFALTAPTVAGGTGWTVALARTGEVVKSAAAGEGSRTAIVNPTPADAFSVTFTGLGRTPDPPNNINPDGSTLLAQIDIDSTVLAADVSRNLRILIAPGGNMRMCDPNVADATDPRAC
jgi:type IV fimbrial biogenesis protein FimT